MPVTCQIVSCPGSWLRQTDQAACAVHSHALAQRCDPDAVNAALSAPERRVTPRVRD